MEVCKSIQPKFNTLLFFEVSDRSFHQVAEVLTKSKTRYSINGWFHGDINYRPEPFIETIPEPTPYIDFEVNIFRKIRKSCPTKSKNFVTRQAYFLIGSVKNT